MMATNIPVMLYTVPALTGMLFMIPAIEFGTKWAWLCYAVTSVLSLILPTEREALIVFIGILGYYPILKMLIERLPSRTIGYLLKFVAFNISIIACYFVIIKVIGVNVFANDTFGIKTTAALLLAAGNVVFLLYDFCLTRVIQYYFIKLRKNVRRALGIKGRQ